MSSFPITYKSTMFGVQPSYLFYNLWRELDWLRVTRRREYWFNSLGRSYTYGRGEGQRTYQPQERHPAIDFVTELLKDEVGFEYEGCFLNGYEDRNDALGWHADDDPGIDHTRPIAVVTVYDHDLAKPRDIEFMNRETGEKLRVPVEHGSLLLMHAGMQTTHFHRIPKAGFEVRPRISLTFRGLIT